MFNWKRAKITNSLTKLINENPNEVTVRDVLSNTDLSPSIRNEVPELLDFFSPVNPDDSPASQLAEERMTELVTLALSKKLNKEGKPYADDKYYRCNRNASNILSSPSRKLHSRLTYKDPHMSPFIELMLKFARGMKKEQHVRTDPMFFGHFHRIFEAIMRSSQGMFLNFFSELDPFYNVLLCRITYSSIRQLFVVLSCEFSKEFSKGCNSLEEVFKELAKYGKNSIDQAKGQKYVHKKKVRVRKSKLVQKQEVVTDSCGFQIVRSLIANIDKKGRYNSLTFEPKPLRNTESVFTLHTSGSQSDLSQIAKTMIISSSAALNNNQGRGSKQTAEKHKKVIHRYDYLLRARAVVTTIRDLINENQTNIQYFQNGEVIESLLEIGKQSPDNSAMISDAYRLILQITAVTNNLEEYRSLLDRYKPEESEFKNLMRRKSDNQKTAAIAEHLIYQMPLYFDDLVFRVYPFFFGKDLGDAFMTNFIFSFTKLLNKNKAVELFKVGDNLFLRKLCQEVGDVPKMAENDNYLTGKSTPPGRRGTLRGYFWELAHYLTTQEIFSSSEVPFMKDEEWLKLKVKVGQYFELVNQYKNDDEEEDMILIDTVIKNPDL